MLWAATEIDQYFVFNFWNLDHDIHTLNAIFTAIQRSQLSILNIDTVEHGVQEIHSKKQSGEVKNVQS